MLSHMFILRKSKNFTSNFLIYISQIIPIHHYNCIFAPTIARRRTNCLLPLSHAKMFKRLKKVLIWIKILFWSVQFFQNKPKHRAARKRLDAPLKRAVGDASAAPVLRPNAAPNTPPLQLPAQLPISTTSFLTTTTLTYTHKAGITAAAGTRLALYLLLISIFLP